MSLSWAPTMGPAMYQTLRGFLLNSDTRQFSDSPKPKVRDGGKGGGGRGGVEILMLKSLLTELPRRI